MRCLVRAADKWKQERPADLSRWLWQHDGQEAVVVDGSAYYCGNEALAQQYRDKWAAEGKYQDERRTADFLDLDREIYNREGAGTPSNDAWCEGEGCYCSAISECNGSCL